MKPDYWDAVLLAVMIAISLATITIFDEARRLAKNQAFCLEQSKRLPLAWDDTQGCVVIDRGSRERRN